LKNPFGSPKVCGWRKANRCRIECRPYHFPSTEIQIDGGLQGDIGCRLGQVAKASRRIAMNRMKWLLGVVAVAMILSVAGYAVADDAKTISGKSSCGGCSGVVKGCCVMLTDSNGDRWVLRGDSDSLKAAFKARHDGKTMTATLADEPVAKKDGDGKEYKEVKVSDVKIDS
jgi:hypothetical protein